MVTKIHRAHIGMLVKTIDLEPTVTKLSSDMLGNCLWSIKIVSVLKSLNESELRMSTNLFEEIKRQVFGLYNLYCRHECFNKNSFTIIVLKELLDTFTRLFAK